MFYWNEIKTTKLCLWYLQNIICNLCYKVITIILTQKCVPNNDLLSPKTSIFGKSQVTINMIQNQTRIQN
jgi:hypothetical protein